MIFRVGVKFGYLRSDGGTNPGGIPMVSAGPEKGLQVGR